MDRSLKWRFIALLGVLVFCACTLASSVFTGKDALPSWFTSVFSKRINLGLDLQGGMHIVYSIDLDKAVDDKATELKRDFEARFTEKGFKALVKTPAQPLGAIAVIPDDPTKRGEIDAQITGDYGKDELVTRDCGEADGSNALCYKVSSDFADGVKKSALANAVTTIRERINEKGVADPSVVEKGDEIIVELPGDPDDPVITETKDIIARTAKLEFKVVDDCGVPDPKGCKVSSQDHRGSPYMKALFKKIGERQERQRDRARSRLHDEIRAETDNWKPEQSGASAPIATICIAYDRDESIPVAEAKHDRLPPPRLGDHERQHAVRGHRPARHRSLHQRRRRQGRHRDPPWPRAGGQVLQDPRRPPARLRAQRAAGGREGSAQVLAHVLPRARGAPDRHRGVERVRQLRSEHEQAGRARSTSTATAAASSAISRPRSSA